MVGEFLSGKLWIERGRPADYQELSRFHYVAGKPGTWAGVWVAKYRNGEPVNGRNGDKFLALSPDRPVALSIDSSRVVAIAVLSWPPLGCSARQSVLHLDRMEMRKRIKWLNQNVRTISRVVVHPQFRGVGLASELVRTVLRESDTQYIETIAAMGKVHPFFEKAGMRRIEHEGGKPYFLWDRRKNSSEETRMAHVE